MILKALAQYWWISLVRGLIAIAFALVAFSWPGATLYALVITIGAWAFIDGILALGAGLFGGSIADRWPLILGGVVGIGAGLLMWFYPGISALTLLVFIGWWAIVVGVLAIVHAIQLRKVIANEWFFILTGVASVLFGGAVIARPGAGALAVLWMIATYALVVGILLIGFALRLRSSGKNAPAASH